MASCGKLWQAVASCEVELKHNEIVESHANPPELKAGSAWTEDELETLKLLHHNHGSTWEAMFEDALWKTNLVGRNVRSAKRKWLTLSSTSCRGDETPTASHPKQRVLPDR